MNSKSSKQIKIEGNGSVFADGELIAHLIDIDPSNTFEMNHQVFALRLTQHDQVIGQVSFGCGTIRAQVRALLDAQPIEIGETFGAPGTFPVSTESPFGEFYVMCEDGNVRHDADFATKAAAREFAEWGHCCTSKHEIVKVEVSA